MRAALLGALLAASIAGCSDTSQQPETDSDVARVPQQVIRGVHLRQTSERGLLWILDAHEGVSYGPEEPLQLRYLTVRFYEGEPDVRSTLTSRRGEVDDRTDLLVAEDSVVVITAAGERLETESLRWDPKRERIATDVYFRLLRGGDVLTGIGFDADPSLTQYTIHRQVRAEVREAGDTGLLEVLDADTTARH